MLKIEIAISALLITTISRGIWTIVSCMWMKKVLTTVTYWLMTVY